MKRNIIDIIFSRNGTNWNGTDKTDHIQYVVETERNEFIKNETERNGKNITDIMQKWNGTNLQEMKPNRTERNGT